MNLVDKIVLAKGGLVVHDCKMYVPKSNGNEGNIAGKRLGLLCEVEAAKHLIEGNFSDPHKFLHNAVAPLLSKNIVEDRAHANYLFDQIYTRHLPLGFGQKDCHFYEKSENGDLRIGNQRFRQKGTKPRSFFNLEEELKPLRGIEIEKTGKGYVVSKKIAPFEMVGEDGRFLFENIWISMDFKQRGQLLKFSEPRTRDAYHHPFVYSDKTICFDGPARWTQKKIHFGTKKIDLTLLRDIDKSFYEAHKNLVKGYQEGVVPVHPLNKLNFPQEYRGAAL